MHYQSTEQSASRQYLPLRIIAYGSKGIGCLRHTWQHEVLPYFINLDDSRRFDDDNALQDQGGK